MNSQSTPRLTGPSPERRRPQLFSGSPARVPARPPCAATGPVPAAHRRPVRPGPRPAAQGLGGDPITQRLVIDPELRGDLTHRPSAVEHQLRGSLPELLGVFAPSAHPGPPSSACAKSGGVQPTGVTSGGPWTTPDEMGHPAGS